MLNRLSLHAELLANSEIILSQIKVIEEERQLLSEHDPLPNLLQNLTQQFRDELNQYQQKFNTLWEDGEAKLLRDGHWQKLNEEQQTLLRDTHGLAENAKLSVDVSSTETILELLERISLGSLKDRIIALPSRYDQILFEAAQLLQPKARKGNLPKRTITTEAEVDEYVEQVSAYLKEEIKYGPIIIQ